MSFPTCVAIVKTSFFRDSSMCPYLFTASVPSLPPSHFFGIKKVTKSLRKPLQPFAPTFVASLLSWLDFNTCRFSADLFPALKKAAPHLTCETWPLYTCNILGTLFWETVETSNVFVSRFRFLYRHSGLLLLLLLERRGPRRRPPRGRRLDLGAPRGAVRHSRLVRKLKTSVFPNTALN